MADGWKISKMEKCKIPFVYKGTDHALALQAESSFEFSTDDEREQILSDLSRARKEWMNAQSLFDEATDPDHIDFVIVMLDAAEKKYNYFLKLARKLGIQIEV